MPGNLEEKYSGPGQCCPGPYFSLRESFLICGIAAIIFDDEKASMLFIVVGVRMGARVPVRRPRRRYAHEKKGRQERRSSGVRDG